MINTVNCLCNFALREGNNLGLCIFLGGSVYGGWCDCEGGVEGKTLPG